MVPQNASIDSLTRHWTYFVKNNRKKGNSFYNLQFMPTMCPQLQELLTLHHFPLFSAVMPLLQKPYLCNFQFIHYPQITMQNTLFQGYRLLIKNLLKAKQISAVDRKIVMIRKLVFCPFQMVKLFMFARNHHHIYLAVLHVSSCISMVHFWSLATFTKEKIC